VRTPLLVVALALASPLSAGDLSEAYSAARAALAARPVPPPVPVLVGAAEWLRAPLIARLRRNPVAAEFAVPLLEKPGAVAIAVRGESEDAGLKGSWAVYRRDARLLVLNRDAISDDLGRAPSTADADAVASRYLPLFVHEIGGHARHYAELAERLGAPAPNVRETEEEALRLEAMTIAAERRLDARYLRDDSEYARNASALVDAYWASREAGDPARFRAWVADIKGYARLTRAADGAAPAAVADYYRDDERRLLAADDRLAGPIPDDERGISRRGTPRDSLRPGRF
jgi:hypothetical protein